MHVNIKSKTLRRSCPLKEENSLAVKFIATSRGKAGISRWEVGGETTVAPHPETRQQITPTRCTDPGPRTRPQAHRGCSYQAPPAGHGLRSPGSRHRSEPLPGWAPRALPRRFGSHSHPSEARTRPLPAPRQQLFSPTRTANPGPGTKRRRRQRQLPSEPRARPACQRPGRPLAAAALPPSAPLPLYFLQPTPLLLRAAEKPVTLVVATASSQCRRRRSDSAPPGRPPVQQPVPSAGGVATAWGRERGLGTGARPRLRVRRSPGPRFSRRAPRSRPGRARQDRRLSRSRGRARRFLGGPPRGGARRA